MTLPRRLSSGAFLLLSIAFNVVGCYGNTAGNDATHINKKGGGYWGGGLALLIAGVGTSFSSCRRCARDPAVAPFFEVTLRFDRGGNKMQAVNLPERMQFELAEIKLTCTGFTVFYHQLAAAQLHRLIPGLFVFFFSRRRNVIFLFLCVLFGIDLVWDLLFAPLVEAFL